MKSITPFLSFKEGKLLPNIPLGKLECSSTPPKSESEGLPTLLIPLEPLTHSIVCVDYHTCTNQDVGAPTSGVRRVGNIRAWRDEEKQRSVNLAQVWEGLMTCSLPLPRSFPGTNAAVWDEARNNQWEAISLDECFVESVIEDKRWRVRDSAATGDADNKGSSECLKKTVCDLCQLLWHPRDVTGLIKKDRTTLLNLRKSRNTVECSAENSEAENIFTIITGVGKDSLDGLMMECDGAGPFFVGLVYREAPELSGTCDKGVTVGTVVETELLKLLRRDIESTSENVDCGEVNMSARVLLLDVAMSTDEISSTKGASPMWLAVLASVHFVYVVGGPVTVARVDSLVSSIPAWRRSLAAGGFPLVHSTAVPSVFYVPKEGTEGGVCCYPIRARRTSSLGAALLEVVEAVATDKAWVQDMLSFCCWEGSRSLLRWSLLLEHALHCCYRSPDCVVVCGIKNRIDRAVKMATDVFTSTAEALLLSMHVMEPLPPVRLYAGDREEAATSIAAIPRVYTVTDALLSAQRVSLLAFNAVTGQFASGDSLLRKKGWEHLQYAHLAAAVAIRERLERFSFHCARRALMSSVVLKEAQNSRLEQSHSASVSGCEEDVSVAFIVRMHMKALGHILKAPLIEHCDVSYNIEGNSVGSGAERYLDVVDPCLGVTATHGSAIASGHHEFRVTESPLTSPWAVASKCTAVCDYITRSFLPRILQILERRSATCGVSRVTDPGGQPSIQRLDDERVHLEARCKAAEVMIELQRGIVKEVKHQRSILSNRLREAQKCLKKLVVACIGYEEIFSGYSQRLTFRLRYSLEQRCNPGASLPGERSPTECGTWSERGDDGKATLSASVVNGITSIAPVAGQEELRQLIFRDAQLQLDTCRSAVQYILEEARQMLNALSIAMMECNVSSESLSPSASLRAIFPMLPCTSVTSGRAKQGQFSTGHAEHRASIRGYVRMVDDTNTENTNGTLFTGGLLDYDQCCYGHNGDFRGGSALDSSHHVASPCKLTPSTLMAGGTETLDGDLNQQQGGQPSRQSVDSRRRRSATTSPSRHLSSKTDVAIYSPKASRAAAEAIAHLQQRQAKGELHMQHLRDQYSEACMSLMSLKEEFKEAVARHQLERKQWSHQQALLQALLQKTVKEAQDAHEKLRMSKESATHEARQRELAAERCVFDVSNVCLESMDAARSAMAEHCCTLMSECKAVLDSAREGSWVVCRRLEEECRARELAAERCVFDVSNVCLESMDAAREAVFDKCVESMGSFSAVCRSFTSNVLRKDGCLFNFLNDDCLPVSIGALTYEAKLKGRRIAELEECIRQKRIICDSLKVTVTYLYRLLEAQRELGMVAPPQAPLVSDEFGALAPMFGDSTAGLGGDTFFSGMFFASPSRSRFPVAYVTEEARVTFNQCDDGALPLVKRCECIHLPSSDILTSVGVGNANIRQCACETVKDSSCGDSTHDRKPRPLSWYLQRIASIESTLRM